MAFIEISFSLLTESVKRGSSAEGQAETIQNTRTSVDGRADQRSRVLWVWGRKVLDAERNTRGGVWLLRQKSSLGNSDWDVCSKFSPVVSKMVSDWQSVK